MPVKRCVMPHTLCCCVPAQYLSFDPLLKRCSPGWCVFVFRCSGELGGRQSTVLLPSRGERANEVSRQMMALSCWPREAMAQRASCRVLSVLCVGPALSATKGSLARQRRGIRWMGPLPATPPPPPLRFKPRKAVNLYECSVGPCHVFKALTNKCHFIRFPLCFSSPVLLFSSLFYCLIMREVNNDPGCRRLSVMLVFVFFPAPVFLVLFFAVIYELLRSSGLGAH